MELRLEVASFTAKRDVLFVVVTHTAIPPVNATYHSYRIRKDPTCTYSNDNLKTLVNS